MPASAPPPEGPRQAERLRFQDFRFEKLPNGRCRSRVVLSWSDGREFVGEAEEVVSETGQLRCSAAATVQALEKAVQPRVAFQILGVKAVRAFDTNVIIVSLSCRADGSQSRLVGSYHTEGDPTRGAALAVLNATNRILGNYYSR